MTEHANIIELNRQLNEGMSNIAKFESENRYDLADKEVQGLYKKFPMIPQVLHLKGIIAYKRKRYNEGVFFMEQSLRMSPDNFVYHRNITDAYKMLSRMDDALESARKAVELAPFDYVANFNLAVIHMDRSEYPESLLSLERAEKLNNTADVQFCKAEINLLLGNFNVGWELYEHRFDIQGAKNSLPPLLRDKQRWRGAPDKDITILIVGDQGYGDNIQFFRFLDKFHETYPDINIIIGASKEIIPLLGEFPYASKITHTIENNEKFDYYIPVSSLPKFLGIDYTNIPNPLKINIPVNFKQKWVNNINNITKHKKIKVGLVWAGRAAHKNDVKRSIELRELKSLFDNEDIEVFSLQKEPANSQIAAYNNFKCAFCDCGSSLNTWEDTAALISCMDIIVSVDTAVAHVSASMGKPTFILIPSSPDWRWGVNSTITPWYSSVTLFRQEEYGKWDKPIANMYEHLLKFIAKKTQAQDIVQESPDSTIHATTELVVDVDNKENDDKLQLSLPM